MEPAQAIQLIGQALRQVKLTEDERNLMIAAVSSIDELIKRDAEARAPKEPPQEPPQEKKCKRKKKK